MYSRSSAGRASLQGVAGGATSQGPARQYFGSRHPWQQTFMVDTSRLQEGWAACACMYMCTASTPPAVLVLPAACQRTPSEQASREQGLVAGGLVDDAHHLAEQGRLRAVEVVGADACSIGTRVGRGGLGEGKGRSKCSTPSSTSLAERKRFPRCIALPCLAAEAGRHRLYSSAAGAEGVLSLEAPQRAA